MTYQYKREPLTDEELNRFINACNDFKECLVCYTLLDTGMRVSELANLKKEQIEWQHNSIIVYGKGGPYGKKTKRRIVPMTDRVKKLLEVHFSTRGDFGISARTIQRIVKKVGNKAGISKKVHPHILRHTFAVKAIRNGIDIKALQLILGHDRLETTAIYLNMSPEMALKEFKEKWK